MSIINIMNLSDNFIDNYLRETIELTRNTVSSSITPQQSHNNLKVIRCMKCIQTNKTQSQCLYVRIVLTITKLKILSTMCAECRNALRKFKSHHLHIINQDCMRYKEFIYELQIFIEYPCIMCL